MIRPEQIAEATRLYMLGHPVPADLVRIMLTSIEELQAKVSVLKAEVDAYRAVSEPKKTASDDQDSWGAAESLLAQPPRLSEAQVDALIDMVRKA